MRGTRPSAAPHLTTADSSRFAREGHAEDAGARKVRHTHAYAWIRARMEMFFFFSLFKPLLFVVVLLLLLFCFVLLH